MTLTEFSETVMAVVGQIVNDHTAYPLLVEADNRDVVDQATQINPYLQVTIAPMHGEQAELGQNPNVKQSGQILLAAVVKSGAGTADAKALLDFVLPYFSMQQLGTIQCQAAYPVQGKSAKGWWYQPAIIPYFYFSCAK
jgi:hypothetical protein